MTNHLTTRRTMLGASIAAGALAAGCDVQLPSWVPTGLPGAKPKTPASPDAPADAPVANGTPGAPPAAPAALDIAMDDAPQQGGAVRGKTAPGAQLTIGALTFKADADGRFIVGFDRDATENAVIKALAPDGRIAEKTIAIARRTFPTQDVGNVPLALESEAVPPDWFDLDDPVPAHANTSLGAADRGQHERELKAIAFTSRSDATGFAETWKPPLKGRRISSQWGARRILHTPAGVKEKTHYGVDIAAMIGTPITAPASGLVVLAEPDMYYEGGCVFIDHGQGLFSIYLHMNELLVARRARVKAGDVIGKVGQKGRASGPHLCWRMKWLETHVDPTLMVGGAQALVAR